MSDCARYATRIVCRAVAYYFRAPVWSFYLQSRSAQWTRILPQMSAMSSSVRPNASRNFESWLVHSFVADCCCNSIAFSLAMLCLKCVMSTFFIRDKILIVSCASDAVVASRILVLAVVTMQVRWELLLTLRSMSSRASKVPVPTRIICKVVERVGRVLRSKIKRQFCFQLGFRFPSNSRMAFNRLPTDIQTAVCNQKIKIFDHLYSLFWSEGSW